MDMQTIATQKSDLLTTRPRERGRDQILCDIIRTLSQITDLLRKPKLHVFCRSPRFNVTLHRIQRDSAFLRSRLVRLPTDYPVASCSEAAGPGGL